METPELFVHRWQTAPSPGEIMETPELFVHRWQTAPSPGEIMETPELFVHRWQTAPSPGAITMVEANLKRTFSSGEGSGHQRQCYNCGKRGHLANVCPSKYKEILLCKIVWEYVDVYSTPCVLM